MNDFNDLVQQAFGEQGAIVKLGGRYTSKQTEYANYITSLLSADNTLGFLQADTGIGKTIGYFVPSLILLNLNLQEHGETKKIIVSTFTRSLQKQILKKDAEFALKILQKIGIENKVKIAYRMGRQAFFSPDRVRIAASNFVLKNPTAKYELEEFIQYVDNSCDVGSGLWSDYLEEHFIFPCGLKPDEICLIDNQKVDNEAYLLHLENAKNADLLITNHASIVNFRRMNITEGGVHALILDEAHEIEGVCLQMFNYRRPIRDIARIFSKSFKLLPKKKYLGQSYNFIKEWESKTIATDKSNFKKDVWTEQSHPHLINEQNIHITEASKLLSKCKKDLDSILHESKLNTETVNFLSDLELCHTALKKWNEQNAYSNRAISFSKVNRNPSIVSFNPLAGRIFKMLAAELTSRVVLTSATLSDGNRDNSFNGLTSTLGFSETDVTISCSLSPSEYANMRFVLTSPDVQAPVIMMDDEEDVQFSESWVQNILKMLEAARIKDESILVLTSSFKEVEFIRSRMSDQKKVGVLFHEKGRPLGEFLGDFVSEEAKVLITPSAWEGVNLRTADDQQLVRHVLITRIPFPPPDLLMNRLIIEYYSKNKGFNPEGIIFLKSANTAITRLKQGMGRGTRNPKDDVLIWFGDSRMPNLNKPNQKNKVLINAIPSRFLGNYSNAEVFGETMKKKAIII